MRWPFLPAEHTVLDATLTSAALHVTLLDRRRVWTRLAGIWTRPDVLNVRGLDVYQVGAFDWLWFPRPTCEVVRALDAHLRERAT